LSLIVVTQDKLICFLFFDALTDSTLEGCQLSAKAGALSGGNTKPFPGPPEEPREDEGDRPKDSGQGGCGCVQLLRKKKKTLMP
jgi:hypothetical protein